MFYVWYEIGYLLRTKKRKDFKTIPLVSLLILLFAGIVSCAHSFKDAALFEFQTYSVGDYTVCDRLNMYILSGLLIFLIYNAEYAIYRKVQNCKVTDILIYVGRNTLPVFVFHAAFFWILKWIGVYNLLLANENILFSLLFVVLCTIVIVKLLTCKCFVACFDTVCKMPQHLYNKIMKVK